MKKITALVLTVLMMVSLFAVPALAGGDELNRAFGFRAQCVSETGAMDILMSTTQRLELRIFLRFATP